MTKTMKMNQMKYYNLIIYYMANIKNSPFLIGGGAAIGLGLLYLTYNKYQDITNNSTNERQSSVDSDSDIVWNETPPISREPSVDNQRRTLSNESNSSTSTYGEFFSGGSKNKKIKKLRKTMRKKNRKGNKSRKK
jgi:hypothetical protein